MTWLDDMKQDALAIAFPSLDPGTVTDICITTGDDPGQGCETCGWEPCSYVEVTAHTTSRRKPHTIRYSREDVTWFWATLMERGTRRAT